MGKGQKSRMEWKAEMINNKKKWTKRWNKTNKKKS